MTGRILAAALAAVLGGCAHAFDLSQYPPGMSERGVTAKLGRAPTARRDDGQGGVLVTWQLDAAHAVVGDFNAEGALIEIAYRQPRKTPKSVITGRKSR